MDPRTLAHLLGGIDTQGCHMIQLRQVEDVNDFSTGIKEYRDTGEVAYIFIGHERHLDGTVSFNEEQSLATWRFTMPYTPSKKTHNRRAELRQQLEILDIRIRRLMAEVQGLASEVQELRGEQ